MNSYGVVLVSDNNMDDLLAQLKTEFEPKPDAKSKAKSKVNRSPASKPQPPQNSASQASIVQMLDELSKEIQSGRLRPDRESNKDSTASKQEVRNSAPERDRALKDTALHDAKLVPWDKAYPEGNRLNALIDAEYQKQAEKREAKLAEIERQKQARIEEQKRRERELIEAQKREELRERRRKEALKEKARQWLKNLNPRSEEGQWFEEFSYSYEDKLQAAIDYLEAMRETGL